MLRVIVSFVTRSKELYSFWHDKTTVKTKNKSISSMVLYFEVHEPTPRFGYYVDIKSANNFRFRACGGLLKQIIAPCTIVSNIYARVTATLNRMTISKSDSARTDS